MKDQAFHFTLGPVQGFVAQARRTRDFWAGSFLLSWLAATAMETTRRLGCEIDFPLPAETYLAWLRGTGDGRMTPRQGAVPNRFKATIRDEHFSPRPVVEAVQLAWRELAERVWQEDLAPFCDQDSGTRAIWNEQIANFWEINWAIGEDSDILDRRKNWRSHRYPEQPGNKCSVMEGWQELSGLPGPDRQRLDAFWNPIREHCRLDMADQEQLCALAFVKRRFVHHFDGPIAQLPGNWTVHGWLLQSGMPSVSYMAVAPWLAEVIENNSRDSLERLHQAAEPLSQGHGEWRTDILCVSRAIEHKGGKSKKLASLDGQVFFRHFLDQADQQKVRRVREALASLDPTPGEPSPFYAILLMDGDSLGSHMGDPVKQEPISKALKAFTDQVEKIVHRHSGFLVYAGGDDVLAVLPVASALPCALALRQIYQQAFEPYKDIGLSSTLSGAVQFVHVRVPLTRVLTDAHDLLDRVVKDGRGRDAIGVRVWKPGGLVLEWAMPWVKAINWDQLEVVDMAEKFAGEEPEFSNRFFYKLRQELKVLNPEDGTTDHPFKDREAEDLLAADYIASGVHSGRKTPTQEEARRRVEPLLRQCRPQLRSMEGEAVTFTPANRWEEDGALLVRFLAQGGRGR